MCLGKLAIAPHALKPMTQPASSMSNNRFSSFAEFYPLYLSEHRTAACRRLHFIGTTLVILLLAIAMTTLKWWLLALMPVVGYCFAWIGHFVFERNKPATFSHPWYSLIGDFAMFRDILVGRIRF
jgi:hypothetical protein